MGLRPNLIVILIDDLRFDESPRAVQPPPPQAAPAAQAARPQAPVLSVPYGAGLRPAGCRQGWPVAREYRKIKQPFPPTITPLVLGRLAHPALHTLAHALPGWARRWRVPPGQGLGTERQRDWGPDANTMRAVEESPRRAGAGTRRQAW